MHRPQSPAPQRESRSRQLQSFADDPKQWSLRQSINRHLPSVEFESCAHRSHQSL